VIAPPVAAAQDLQVERGAYLVAIAGCSDCHTPGGLLGSPDTKRMLGGSDVGFGAPGYGVAVGSNLTPDKQTGLGGWSSEQIIKAMTQGLRPDGSVLSGAMPWQAFSRLTAPDAQAIVAYLQSLPAVNNAVPGPFGPKDRSSVAVSVIVSGEAYAALPQPPPPK
jgi:mono/diheme cytochrome c family protein